MTEGLACRRAAVVMGVFMALTTSLFSQSTWKARYKVGTEPIPDGRKLEISLDSDQVDVRSDRGERFQIPIGSLQAIFYDTTVNNRAIEYAKHGPGWVSLARSPPELFAGLVLDGLTMAVLAPFHRKDHFVHLVWVRDDTPHTAVMELGKKDYLDCLTRVSEAAQVPWLDLPRQREEMKQEFEAAREVAHELQLRTEITVGERILEPGEYRLVVGAADPAGKSRLYWCEGRKARLKDIRAVAPVEIVPAPEILNVGYTTEVREGTAIVTGVELPGRRLKVQAPPRSPMEGLR